MRSERSEPFFRLPLQVLAPLLALSSLADADTSGLYHDRPERPTLVPALRQKDVNGGSFPPDFTSPHAMLPAPAAKDLDDKLAEQQRNKSNHQLSQQLIAKEHLRKQ